MYQLKILRLNLEYNSVFCHHKYCYYYWSISYHINLLLQVEVIPSLRQVMNNFHFKASNVTEAVKFVNSIKFKSSGAEIGNNLIKINCLIVPFLRHIFNRILYIQYLCVLESILVKFLPCLPEVILFAYMMF